jgi:glycosyltransferase involved in cell wall biosynthesis
MPSVALLPWGDVVEDFLDPLGIGLEGLRDEMSGGWLFGVVEALGRAGVEPALVVVSRSVREPARWRHGPTGAPLVLLPSPRAYRALRRTVADPYGWTADDSARTPGARGRLAAQPGRQLGPYLATPLRALAGELRRMRADALLCQEYEYARFDVCVALGRVLRLPVCATFQGGDAPRTGLERLVRPLAIRGARALVVGASGEAERVRARYRLPAGRVARIPNPLDVDRWGGGARRAVRAELGLPDDALVVAWHGRVELHRKGLDLLLGAWRELAGAPGSPRRLLLVGTGKEADALRRWIRADALPGVVWVDEYVLDKARVAGYLAAADVYAFPSRHEGFAVAPLEAMASGLPVVATAAAGVAEIAPDGERSGVVVVPRDAAAAFTAALADLLQQPARRASLGRSARARVAGAFSLDAVGRQLRDVLLGTGSPSSQWCGGRNTPPSEDEPSTRSGCTCQ